ncbi:MAG TPA: hypothetical protein VE646_13170 [Actinomycetota bacterium]|jgi:hypothetical protein|nr:hypothetical protein [Actinomycetota bacterium]
MGRGKDPKTSSGFLERYRRVRKPMPPPERVILDQRRRRREEQARREIEEEVDRGSETDDVRRSP